MCVQNAYLCVCQVLNVCVKYILCVVSFYKFGTLTLPPIQQFNGIDSPPLYPLLKI